MSSIVIVDDATTLANLLGEAIARQGPHDVQVVSDPAAVTSEFVDDGRFDLALVDLSFPTSDLNGLDVLLVFHETAPQTRLAVITQGDDWVADLMRVTWEALPLAGAFSKSAPLETVLRSITQILRAGSAPPDPVLAPLLPARRSEARSFERFGRLIGHRGHAKLWKALIDSPTEPSYIELRDMTGLKVNTLRNYREHLLAELALHGLHGPTLRDLYRFAQIARPLLLPHIERRLSPPPSTSTAPDPTPTVPPVPGSGGS